MTSFEQLRPCEQSPTANEPYDRWVSPEGNCVAAFHRADKGFLVRFAGEVDFLIDEAGENVAASPAPDTDDDRVCKLFENSILPLIGNHRGGLYLHGSAVEIDSTAVAFLGHSRSGKTTLAGAFARSGYPFMTEDVVDLEREEAHYMLRPKRTDLRLFADSAQILFGKARKAGSKEEKLAYAGGPQCPFREEPAPLRAMFLIGGDHSSPIRVKRLHVGQVLTSLMQHAFVLDVEDRERMEAHFGRLADLAESVPAFALDYPRDYSALPEVIDAVVNARAGLDST